MSASDAWLLAVTKQLHVAIGNLEMVHIHFGIPDLIAISHEDSYCQHEILWQGQHLSLLDLDLFLSGEPYSDKTTNYPENMYLCIVAYISAQEEVQEYGAILSIQSPVRITVDDKQACELPGAPERWSMLAISCFSHNVYGTVPILDLPRIFSTHVNLDALADPDI